MKSLLIPVKPETWKRLREGSQDIVILTTMPKMPVPYRVYFYERKNRFITEKRGARIKYGYGKGQIVGFATCVDTKNFPFDEDIIEPTPAYDGDESCIHYGPGHWITTGEVERAWLTEEDLKQYEKAHQNLFGLVVRGVEDLKTPVALKEFGIKHAPIKFCYIEE